MEKCLSTLGCELCQCVFKGNSPDTEVDVKMYLKLKGYQETLHWILLYNTIEAEQGRRLCRISQCKKCQKLYCEGVEIPEDKAGDNFLALVYRWLYQEAYNIKYELTASPCKFNEEFLKLFDEKDKPFIAEWLKRPENQSVYKMYRN